MSKYICETVSKTNMRKSAQQNNRKFAYAAVAVWVFLSLSLSHNVTVCQLTIHGSDMWNFSLPRPRGTMLPVPVYPADFSTPAFSGSHTHTQKHTHSLSRSLSLVLLWVRRWWAAVCCPSGCMGQREWLIPSPWPVVPTALAPTPWSSSPSGPASTAWTPCASTCRWEESVCVCVWVWNRDTILN